jgi:two-component sensor histidine kinase
MEQLLDTPDLAGALESDRFKQFLDQVPVAIAVSELSPVELIVYANAEFERLIGQPAETIVGGAWDRLPGAEEAEAEGRELGAAVVESGDYIGAFRVPRETGEARVDAWSNVIEDDDGSPVFRLVALMESVSRDMSDKAQLELKVQEKDTQLRELQHRVKNNLQMITALIRVEARGVTDETPAARFDRLAGRIEALGLLYRSLSETGPNQSVDLGIYLSEVASAVMRAHAPEGIHLNLQVDTWPVSLDVAMPAGLVVNELLTNALKHAFVGREGGTITLHSLTDATGCRVLVADDGAGLPEGMTWPRPGKLSALIVKSLQQNAKATLEVDSAPDAGMRVTIFFACADAVP